MRTLGGLKQAFENPLIPKFSVQRAIWDEVEREDLARWGQSREYPFQPVTELPIKEKSSVLALWRFAKSFNL